MRSWGGGGGGAGAGRGDCEEKAIGVSMRHPHIVFTVSNVCQLRFAALIRTVLTRFTESSCQSHKLYDMTCCQHQQQQNLR